jgi:ABC-type branched-subunit amino acid transport system permease subunit
MLYYIYETYGSFFKKTWAWALGGLIGVITGLNSFPMKIPYFGIDGFLLWQLAKILLFAILGGAGTNIGKWVIDVIRKKITGKSAKRKK